jgi:putative toxin-antitoxin system antitoxin component (TIGR02293 family)
MNTVPKQVARRPFISDESFINWGRAITKMNPLERIKMIRDGIAVGRLVEATKYYGISQMELAKILGVSNATITRKIKSASNLGPIESERLARIALIETEAEEVFSTPDQAKRWMLEPNLALGESPFSLLDTDSGAHEVKKLLSAIAYGGVA